MKIKRTLYYILILLGIISCNKPQTDVYKQNCNYTILSNPSIIDDEGLVIDSSSISISKRFEKSDFRILEYKLPKSTYKITHTYPLNSKKILLNDGENKVFTSKIGTPKKLNIKPFITPASYFTYTKLDNYSFKEIGTSQGLQSTFITAIYKDSRGYFWFGSRRGLSRYDGQTFHYFPFAEENEERSVGAITEDKNGHLWISFSSNGGLIKYDGNYFYEYIEGESLHFNEQYLGILCKDRYHNIWMKTDNKIIKFKNDQFTVYPFTFQDFSFENVISKEGENGNIWLSAHGGLCVIQKNDISYMHIEQNNEMSLCHPIEIKGDKIIFSTGNSINILENQSLKVFESEFVSNNEIRNTLKLNNGFVISSQEKNNAFCEINDSILTETWIKGPIFSDSRPFFKDEYENIWFSDFTNGVQCYNNNKFEHFKFEYFNNGGHISSLLETKDGNIWFGSHGFGLLEYNGKVHQFVPLDSVKKDIAIRELHQDSKGNIWVGTVSNGLYKVNKKNDDTYEITHFNLFENEQNAIYAIEEDTDNNIWIGTGQNGLYKYNGKNFVNYKKVSSNTKNDSVQHQIRSLITDNEGLLCIGINGNGYAKLKDGKFVLYNEHNGLTSNNIVSLFEDSESNIWLGSTDKGLLKIKSDSIYSIDTQKGLSSNAVWSIIEDNEKNIWVGAGTSLNIIFYKKNDFQNEFIIKSLYDIDGISGAEYYSNAVIKTRDNKLFWGTDKMAFKVTNSEKLTKISSVTLSLEQINIINNQIDFNELEDHIKQNQEVLAGVNNDLNLAKIQFDKVEPFSNTPINLVVPEELNDISFVFSSKGNIENKNLKFSYFLVGIDKDWSIPSYNNKVDFKGLPPGKYILKAKVSETSGTWSDPVSYSFEVLPFWWKTWWAIVIWTLIPILIFSTIFRVLYLRRKSLREAKKIKEIEHLKSELYANITHEFRTPLTMILAMNDQIKGFDKEKRVIFKNSQQLLDQVNQLLDSSKNETGKLKLHLKQGNIVHFIEKKIESFIITASEKDILLTLYSEENEIIMDFDASKIEKIISNLLSNALKYTPKKGKVILHITKQNMNNQPFLIIKVSDTGIGIPENELLNVFNRFYQIPNTATSSGSGIGLSFTKELVTLLNGKIEVKSEINKGSIFTVNIPIKNECEMMEDEIEKTIIDFKNESEISNTKQRFIERLIENESKKLQILIIEDNEDISEYIKELLIENYDVHIAQNGEIGLKIAFEIIPDAIISDIMMPIMDGYEVCQKLKSNIATSHIPIVLLTAKIAQEDKLKGLKYGADAYLTKPFNKEELKLRVQKLIELRTQLQNYFTKQNTSEAIINIPEQKEIVNVENEFILKLNEILAQNLSDSEFGVVDLSDEAGLSQMQLYRKLKALVDKTPSQFIRSFRLKKGLDLLQNSDLNISEIAYEVGFSDPNYFSRTFHKEFGNPPGAYRKN